MARTNRVQASFIAGEFSSRLFGRIDVDRFSRGAAVIENFILKPGGGLFRTPGTKHLGEVKDSSKSTRLLPFIYSADDAVQVELGDQYTRFWDKDGTQVDSGGPVELSTPWTEAQLFDTQFAQSRDVMYLTHPQVSPRTITRNSATSYATSTISWMFAPARTLDPGQRVRARNFSTWAAGDTGELQYDNTPAFATDASVTGMHFLLKDESDPTKLCVLEVTSRKDADEYNVTAVTAIPSALQGNFTSLAWEPAFSDTQGWPSTITFFENRMWFGGTARDPNGFWGSRTGDFIDFNPDESADDDGIAFKLTGGQSQTIEWMEGGQDLLIGTSKTVWKATGGLEQAITPSRIFIREQSRRAVASQQPIAAGYHTLFIQRARHKLRSMTFEDAQTSYLDTDLSTVAEHIFRGARIFNIAFAEERDRIVWAGDGDGQLAGLTFDPENNVIGWHRHPDTNGEYESVSVIPQADFDETWFIVKRTINGATKRYIERMVEGEVLPANKADYFFMRCGITKTGSSFTTVDGLDHLEGESVIVLGDGIPMGPFTVSSGSVELETAVNKAQAGLAYTSKMETLPVPVGTSRTKGWAELMVRIEDTMSLTINGKVVGLREPSEAMGSSIEPKSKDIEVDIEGYDLRAQNEFTCADPVPCNILMVAGTLYVGDT